MKRKRLMALVMAGMAAMIIAGCSGTGSTEESSTESASAVSAESDEGQSESTESSSEAASISSSSETENISSASETSEEDSDILLKMAEANDMETLIGEFGSVYLTQTSYSALGEPTEMGIYMDESLYVNHSELSGETYTVIGDEAGLYGETVSGNFCYMFAGITYDEWKWTDLYGLFYYNESENLISQETADGIITVETTIDGDAAAYILENLGYSSDAADYLRNVYEVDAETYIIQSSQMYRVSGEDETLTAEITVALGGDAPEYDTTLKDAVYGGETWTLTAIANNGTDDEQTYTQSASKGTNIIIAYGSLLENTIYSDAEYTTVVESLANDSDQTVYLKSAE